MLAIQKEVLVADFARREYYLAWEKTAWQVEGILSVDVKAACHLLVKWGYLTVRMRILSI